MAYWLVKTEPEVYSIDDLKRDKVTYWDGVRNYQARNFLKDMKLGEHVLIYHSNASPPAIVGLAKVSAVATADPSQFDKKSPYYDPKATEEAPRWFCPDLRFVKKFKSALPLPDLREMPALKDMLLLRKGSRLSVMPVSEQEFETIVKAAG